MLALLAAAILCVPGFGATLSTNEIEAHVGMFTVGNWLPPDYGLSPPLFLIGASTIIDLDTLPEPWVLGLGVDFLGMWYEWDDVNRWARLSDLESGSSFFTVGVLVSPRIGARFPLGEAVAMGAFAGLDLLIRFPFYPFPSVPIVDEQLPALLYFIAGRFIYPEIGGWLTWRATEQVELAFALRSLWPLYRIWSPEATGFSTILHQVIFAGTLGATIRLGTTVSMGGKSEAPPAP